MDGKDYLIILGAPKCGTTSLTAWMAGWPDTAVARGKETLFFTDYTERRWTGPGADHASHDGGTEAGFRGRFDHAPDAGLRVEASTDNLSCPLTPGRIADFVARSDVGRVRLVAVLRDPVERIVSEFEHTLRYGWQRPNLMRSLKKEDRRRRAMANPLFWHVYRTRYHSQLAPFRAAFGADLLILDYHRLTEPDELHRLARFAGRDSAEMSATLERRNARRVHARPHMEAVLREGALATAARRVIPAGLRKRLRALALGELQGRYTPSRRERAFILDRLAAEIDGCVKDPEIRTDRWTSLHED
jgi:hypothetical protein